jgi:hypothetical protein
VSSPADDVLATIAAVFEGARDWDVVDRLERLRSRE